MSREPDTFTLIASLMESGAPFCVATVVRTKDATSAKAGAKAVVLGDGTIKGHLGGGCVQGAVRKTALGSLKDGQPKLIRIKPTDEVIENLDLDGTELHKSHCPSGGTVDIFIEPMRPAPRLVICGASPVAVAVADLGKRLGYRVVAVALADDLAAFDQADERLAGFDLAGLGIAAHDYVVVATQGKRDREALTAALNTEAAYVGFVGSRKKVATLAAQLREQGVAQDRIARLAAPAGLDIHAIEPAEIALSILGEVVAHRRKGIKEGAAEVAEASAGVTARR